MKYLLGFLVLVTTESKADAVKVWPRLTEPCPNSQQIQREESIDGGEYNVYDYGAKGDGSALDTQAIQRAIDSCNKGGGGTVLLPYGKFLSGTLFLKDNVYIQLESAATLLGSTNLNDYNSKRENLIFAQDAHNIGIVGTGTIDGNGESYWKGKDRPYNRPDIMLLFDHSKNILIEGITIVNAPKFNLLLYKCDRGRIDGVTILNDRDSPNTDGIDLVSSSNIFISNCYIDTGDDAICLKSDKGKITENIVVTNCILRSDDSAIKCGTNSEDIIRHCLFSNIVIRDSKYGIAFFMKDGGSYKDFQFSNISIETKVLSKDEQASSDSRFLQKYYPIFLDIESRTPRSNLGTISNISFKDITIDTWNGNALIQGSAEKPIQDITMDNVFMRVHSRVDYTGRWKPRGTRLLKEKAENDFADVPAHFTFANVDGLTLKSLTIEDVSTGQSIKRHAISGLALKNVSMDGFRYTPTAADNDLSAIDFQDCEGVLIKGCMAPVSNTYFITVRGESSRNINVIGNDISRSAKGVGVLGANREVLFESANREGQK